ncbi:pentatricopeptide repeat-containing protein At5g66520-like [Abrus precatorius]|uniref:Pentatricopeptide repeat-containing protein At5g66520-like n=1 Tax=Abrus precatorius TaxID=3816 RepID=A0A8B8K3U6_ABRPR|nr:pentatricopeptide repeat-containing protein At5g66520-like [Abrus precatorius]
MTSNSVIHKYSTCLRLLEGLSSSVSMREVKQIHAHAITHDLARFAFVSSKILAFCALSQRGDLRYAQTLFTRMPLLTLFDFNSMIIAFSKHSQFHNASTLFPKMLNDAVRPNSHTFAVLAKACLTESFLQQLHAFITKTGHVSDVYVVSSVIRAYSKHGAIRAARRVFDESSNRNVACWTSLVTGYCNCGLVDEARGLFDAIPQRNDVSYSAMVSGYVRNGRFREGIELFRELKGCASVRPNNSLLVSVLNACAAVGAFEEGKGVHTYVDENGLDLEYEVELGTAMIDFYTKCGCVEAAERVFGNMKVKDVTAWSAMIMGLAINGKNHMALELFAKMEEEGPKPNAVAFIGVLSACNHKDLSGEALRIFRYMSEKYGIVAWIEHYGCVVDVLARSGQIKEALRFIESMPMEADGAIWGSLLNGCVLHGQVELGQKVGRYLIKFEPRHSGRYVLLANVYASVGKWEGVSEMRKLMRERGVPIVSASSFIEIDRTIHKFVVDDKSCSFSGQLYQLLHHLGKKLEDYSVPNDLF